MEALMQNSTQKWDKFWRQADPCLLKGKLEAEDSWYALAWKVGLEYWEEVFRKYAHGKRLLECGSGVAKTSFYMAKQGYDCFMLDTSLEGLKAAKQNFSSAGINGHFILSKAEIISLKDASMDIVYSGGLLNYFDDVAPFIKEMQRVLKPGGLFAATIITSRRFSAQTLGDFQIFWAKFIKYLFRGEWKGIIQKSRKYSPFYENDLTLNDYKRVLKDCGIGILCATGTSPFPAIALPRGLRFIHVKIIKLCLPFWRWFNQTQARFTEKWGIAFSIYGIKQG